MSNHYDDENEFDDIEPPLGWAEGEREAMSHKMKLREAEIMRARANALIEEARRSPAAVTERTSTPSPPPAPVPTRPRPKPKAPNPENIEQLRKTLDQIAERGAREFDYLPVASVWPLIKNLVVALTYSSGERRSDAVERFSDDLLRIMIEGRKAMAADDRVAPTSQKMGFLP
ncbi:hypothetical protein KIP88_18840 [Bradyrhizobium sp. SRL28]|uniref:hypothetical protein n=1 Tax=Bradyrhizobium sp. SRL28 TaxID=2836178 RepID=UPI001BDF56CA|nr:hypothetical protein [Bradyrhizobium sp. SRL28]MBT1512564.1 hypothetical protein [Bradyrhizobium sp. SRL28]